MDNKIKDDEYIKILKDLRDKINKLEKEEQKKIAYKEIYDKYNKEVSKAYDYIITKISKLKKYGIISAVKVIDTDTVIYKYSDAIIKFFNPQWKFFFKDMSDNHFQLGYLNETVDGEGIYIDTEGRHSISGKGRLNTFSEAKIFFMKVYNILKEFININ